MSKNTLCFYHVADLDGHSSGGIVKHFRPETELIGFNYGYDFPWDKIQPDSTVYIVDLSLPLVDMVELAKILKDDGELIWIDHHSSIISEFEELDDDIKDLFDGKLSTKKAACELTWEYFMNEPAPPVIELLGIYDSWRFSPDEECLVKDFQLGMRLNENTKPDVFNWSELFDVTMADDWFQSVLNDGITISTYQANQNKRACDGGAFEYDWNPPAESGLKPLKCIAINSSVYNSDLFSSVGQDKYDAMICFNLHKSGNWRCSIYSVNPDIDCSQYAKLYGGGGHKGASGFSIDGPCPFKPKEK
jgi:oligoribonuclease NrnB/cAMP/cGMP phosphodiesterase (DHH superfamily)